MSGSEKGFFLAISGINLQVHCRPAALEENLRARYQAFLAPDRPGKALSVTVEQRGSLRQTPFLAREISFSERGARFSSPGFEGWISPPEGIARLSLSAAHPADEVEYFLRVATALLAFREGGFLFHSAGIIHDGRVACFFGHSGSGKTTVARLSPPERVLNDDLILVLPSPSGWTAAGTPFFNPSQVPPRPGQALIGGLFHLVQSSRLEVAAMPPALAVAELAGSVPVIPADRRGTLPLLERLYNVIRGVPVYQLHFPKTRAFWELIDTTLRERP